MISRFFKSVFLAAGIAAFFAACFTEVGNPDEETSMSARVRITYDPDSAAAFAPDSVAITALELRLLEAAYRGADSAEHPLWSGSQGADLDFVGEEALPLQALAAPPVKGVEVRLGASPAAVSIRGTYWIGGTVRAFRLSVPDTAEIFVRYDSAALAAWRSGSRYDCRIVFFARRWLSVPGLDSAEAVAEGMDGAETPVVLLDAEHNGALYRLLIQNLGHAFNGTHAYPKRAGTP